MSAPQAADPSRDFRVLDLTRLLPGPVCTLYLADLGADVVKIEDTGAGDYARTTRQSPRHACQRFFRAVNRNKRIAALDLKDPRGRDAFLALARRADVIVESFRPGVVAKLGVDYDTLPRSIRASSTRRFQATARTARARKAGHDINYLGYAGVLDQSGVRDGPPALSQPADRGSAWRRGERGNRDPRGTRRRAAHRVAAATSTSRWPTLRSRTTSSRSTRSTQWGRTLPRGEDLLTGGVPCYGVYPTLDGRWLAVGALEDKFWQALCATIERPDLAQSGLALGEEGTRVRNELESIFAAAPLAHWIGSASPTSIAASRRSSRSTRRCRSAVHRARDGRATAGWHAAIRAAVQAVRPRVRRDARSAGAGRAHRRGPARGGLR